MTDLSLMSNVLKRVNEGRSDLNDDIVEGADLNNPDKIYADITRGEYRDYKKNFADFEKEMIKKATTDTSIIDQAKENLRVTPALMQGVAKRNMDRYGVTLTPAQIQAMDSAEIGGRALNTINTMESARISQKEANQALLADLINIGQGVNRASQSQLASAASDAVNRKNAYQNAKAAAHSQNMSLLGGLGMLFMGA